MKRWGKYWMVAMWAVGALSVLGTAQEGVLDTVRAVSEGLASYSATICMTQHTTRGESTIRFDFDFAPPDRMRISYDEPVAVRGQLMILNADRFYTYLPTLDRQVWKTVDDQSNDQGEEMGFLYDFVTCRAAAFLESNPVDGEPRQESYVLEGSGATLDVVAWTFQTTTGRQVVRFCTADATPVSVDIYVGDDLAMSVQVLSYCLDGEIDESVFAIPERT